MEIVVEGKIIGSLSQKPEQYESPKTVVDKIIDKLAGNLLQERRANVLLGYQNAKLLHVLETKGIAEFGRETEDEKRSTLNGLPLEDLRLIHALSHPYPMQEITGAIGITPKQMRGSETFTDVLDRSGTPVSVQKGEQIWELVLTPRVTNRESTQVADLPSFLECIDILRLIDQKTHTESLPKIIYTLVEPSLAKELCDKMGWHIANIQQDKSGKLSTDEDEFSVRRALSHASVPGAEDQVNFLLFIKREELFAPDMIKKIEDWRDSLYRVNSGSAQVTPEGLNDLERKIRIDAITDYLS